MATAAAIPTNVKWWNGGKSPFNASYGKVMMWYFLMSDAFTFGAFLISYGTIRFSQTSWPDPNVVFNAVPGLHGMNLPLIFVSIMTFILIASSVTMVLAVHEGHQMNKKGVEKYMWYTIIGGAMFLGCQALEWHHLLTGSHAVLVNDPLTNISSIESWAQTTVKNPWGPAVEDVAQIKAAFANSTKANMISLLSDMHGSVNATHDELLAMSKPALIDLASKNITHVATPGAIAFGGYFYGITGFHGFHVLSGVVINIILLIKTKLGHFEQRGHYEMIEKGGLYWHFVDLVWVFVFLCFYLV